MCLATKLTPKWHFVLGLPLLPSRNPKIFKVRTPTTLFVDLWLRCSLKKICNLCWELSNSMSYATRTQGNWGNSQLLVVGSQIANLTPDPSFGRNLCFKCPNGSREPTLDIYVIRSFQWYKEHFNPMGFVPCHRSLKIQESIGTSTPKMGAHLGMWVFIPSHSPTLLGAWDVILKLPSWLPPLQALALVTSPRLGLWQSMHGQFHSNHLSHGWHWCEGSMWPSQCGLLNACFHNASHNLISYEPNFLHFICVHVVFCNRCRESPH